MKHLSLLVLGLLLVQFSFSSTFTPYSTPINTDIDTIPGTNITPTLFNLKMNILYPKFQNNWQRENAHLNKSVFCSLERKIDKSSKLNLRLRVGSVAYTDHIEGKHYSIIDYHLNQSYHDK